LNSASEIVPGTAVRSTTDRVCFRRVVERWGSVS